MYKILDKFEAMNIFKNEWSQPGRHIIFSDAVIKKKIERIKLSISTVSKDEIKKKIQTYQQKVVIGQGRVPVTKQYINPSRSTTNKY